MRDTRVTDSIYIHDSVIIREGPDTMWLERWRTCWRDRIVHDTVRIHTSDTVFSSVEKVETNSPLPPSQRENRTPGWAWVAVAALAGLIIAQIIRVKNRLNKL